MQSAEIVGEIGDLAPKFVWVTTNCLTSWNAQNHVSLTSVLVIPRSSNHTDNLLSMCLFLRTVWESEHDFVSSCSRDSKWFGCDLRVHLPSKLVIFSEQHQNQPLPSGFREVSRTIWIQFHCQHHHRKWLSVISVILLWFPVILYWRSSLNWN